MLGFRLHLAIPAILAALAAGCAAPPPLAPTEITQAELDAFLASGHSPRNRGITVYRSPAGPSFQFANRPWSCKSVRVPFCSPKNLPLPAVEAKTATFVKFNLLFDTSARQSWLLFASCKAMDFSPFKETPGDHPIGERADHVLSPIPGYAGVANKIILSPVRGEPLHVESPVFYTPPARGLFGPLARPDAAPAASRARKSADALDLFRRRVHAVAGSALLRSFASVRLDFPARSAALVAPCEISPTPYKPSAPVVADLPLDYWRERPAVRVSLDGHPILAVVDTAGDFALSLPSDLLPGLGEADLAFGPALIPSVPVSRHSDLGLPEAFPARIGWRFWREYALALDFQFNRLWLEDPASHPAADDDSKKTTAPAGPVHYRGIDP